MNKIKLKFSMDVNGNRIVKLTRKGLRGFSVQTNGNLPKTHSMTKGNMDVKVVLNELRAFCTTAHQQNLLSHNPCN